MMVSMKDVFWDFTIGKFSVSYQKNSKPLLYDGVLNNSISSCVYNQQATNHMGTYRLYLPCLEFALTAHIMSEYCHQCLKNQ